MNAQVKMINEVIEVRVMIHNLPQTARPGYMVVRRDEYTADLWYYGTFETEERAFEVAQELDNGIVLERADI